MTLRTICPKITTFSISKSKRLVFIIMNLQQLLSEDTQYQQLCLEFTQCNQQFLEIVLSLPKEKQAVIFDFLDITSKMFGRVFEVASEEE